MTKIHPYLLAATRFHMTFVYFLVSHVIPISNVLELQRFIK